MECSVCLMTYSPQLRPLSLPCGHTFCKLCITKVYRERGVVMCPKCQAQHRRTTIDNLPVNYELEDLMESLNVREAASARAQPSSQSSNQELCSKCHKLMSSWCENCLVFVCNGCTARQHQTKGHKTMKAKEAIEKLRAECIEKLDAKDVLLNKNISTCKELLASSSAMVHKINKAVTQMEQHRNEVLAQKVGMQSGASLAAVAKSATDFINQSKKPSSPMFQELKEAQGSCRLVGRVMTTFKGLATDEQPGSQTVVDGPVVETPPTPQDDPDPEVIPIGNIRISDPVIAACQDPLPRMLKGRPRGTDVLMEAGQSLPFWARFKLKSTSPNCWFNIYFRAPEHVYLLDLRVKVSDGGITMEAIDGPGTRKRFECHLPPQRFEDEFFLRVKEMDEKYVLKIGEAFIGYCKKVRRTGKKSKCTKITIEGKHTRLLEFKVLNTKE